MSKFDHMNEALKSPVDAKGYPITHSQWIEAQERIRELEAALARVREVLEKLARLGNGDQYGNSDGNRIAQAALKALQEPEHE